MGPYCRFERRTFGHLVNIVGLAAIGVLAVWFVSLRRQSSTPRLIADPKALDLGDVWVTDSHAWTIPVHNSSDRPVQVDFAASCRCAGLSPASTEIPAHGRVDLHLTINLLPTSAAEAGNECRDFFLEIVPIIRQQLRMHRRSWRVTGRVMSPFVIPTGAVLPDWIEDSTDARSLRIKSFSALRSVTITTPSEFVDTSIELGDDETTCLLRMSPHRNLPVGSHTIRVSLAGVTRDGNQLSSVPIIATLNVVADIMATPSTVVAGIRPIHGLYSASLELASRSGKPFSVRTAEPSGTLEVSPIHEEIGDRAASHHFQLTQRGIKPGVSRDSVRFGLDCDGVERELVVPVVCYGRPDPESSTR